MFGTVIDCHLIQPVGAAFGKLAKEIIVTPFTIEAIRFQGFLSAVYKQTLVCRAPRNGFEFRTYMASDSANAGPSTPRKNKVKNNREYFKTH